MRSTLALSTAFVLDQVLKAWAKGAGWDIALHASSIDPILLLSLGGALLGLLAKAVQPSQRAALGCLAVGFASNSLDRLLHPGVIDYAIVSLPGGLQSVFNLADLLLLGGALWLLGSLRKSNTRFA